MLYVDLNIVGGEGSLDSNSANNNIKNDAKCSREEVNERGKSQKEKQKLSSIKAAEFLFEHPNTDDLDELRRYNEETETVVTQFQRNLLQNKEGKVQYIV